MTVVIVGAGLGGLRTAEFLRRGGFTGAITLIGAEIHPPYNRPPLSKHVLYGDVTDTSFPADAEKLQLELRLGVRVTGLDPAAREVRLADGTTVSFEHLVLAPGAEARLLPGVDRRPGVHVVRTIDDARHLRAALDRSMRIVVVGGGFIGCEVAASARKIGADVDLVEVLDAPLLRVLGPAGSAVVTGVLTGSGVRLHTGVGVEAIEGEGSVTGVRVSDGTLLATTDVVLGLGVVLDLDWLAGSGIELSDGIVCDAGGHTSVPGVYAVGDAANWHHSLAGGNRRVEHWTTVADQAQVVAANIMAEDGQSLENDAVPYFWSDIGALKIQALGFVDPADDVDAVHNGEATILVYSREGRVRSIVGFGAGPRVMRQRGAVAEAAPRDEVIAALQA